MQKSYEWEVATHIGPESCGAARKGGVEALTGERAGRVFSRVRKSLRDADAVGESGRPHLVRRNREARQSPARSETPCTYAPRLPHSLCAGHRGRCHQEQKRQSSLMIAVAVDTGLSPSYATNPYA